LLAIVHGGFAAVTSGALFPGLALRATPVGMPAAGDKMRRLIRALLPLFLVAACDGGGAPPPAVTAVAVQAGFPRGGLADTITVSAVDRLPLRVAELVAPDGTATPANWIDVNNSPRVATGQWVAGNPWETAVTGATAAAALTTQNAQLGAALQGQVQLLATVSTAEIPLPDPVAYRRDWANYRIRLTFGTPPRDVETRQIAAPEPPPG